MVIFHSYVSLPEGSCPILQLTHCPWMSLVPLARSSCTVRQTASLRGLASCCRDSDSLGNRNWNSAEKLVGDPKWNPTKLVSVRRSYIHLSECLYHLYLNLWHWTTKKQQIATWRWPRTCEFGVCGSMRSLLIWIDLVQWMCFALWLCSSSAAYHKHHKHDLDMPNKSSRYA